MDPKLLIPDPDPDPPWRVITDPDPDLTWRVISDSDPTLQVVLDLDPDPDPCSRIFVKYSYLKSDCPLKNSILC